MVSHIGINRYRILWYSFISLLFLQYDEFLETSYPVLTIMVFIAFMVLVPILFLNMLIATMTTTYERNIRNAEKDWIKQVNSSCDWSPLSFEIHLKRGFWRKSALLNPFEGFIHENSFLARIFA